MTDIPKYVDLHLLQELIGSALGEDVGSGDVTSIATIPADTTATAVLKAKEDGVVAGLLVAGSVFHQVDSSIVIEWFHVEGDFVRSGTIVGTFRGSAHAILKAERVALNFLQRMSGIATLTRNMVKELENTRTKLLDTRKTVPGLRMLDKWAVLLGGGQNHRVGLFDMILIKENHIAAAGGIESALSKAQHFSVQSNPPLKIEIEVTSVEELKRVLSHGGAHRVMLDNFVSLDPSGKVDTTRLVEALALVDGTLETEASGNVTLSTLGAIGRTGVDYVSSGALTHSVRALDLSLLVTLDS